MIKKLTLLLICSVFGLYSFAGGYQVALQGQKQIGMAHVGTGLALDNSAIFFNPGALSFVKRRSITGSFSPIFAHVQYRGASPSDYTARNEPGMGTPFAMYADFNLNPEDKWKVGIGVYTPFGSSLEYAEGWKGRFMLNTIDLQAISIQPTFSYKINDMFGIGAGLTYTLGSFELNRSIPLDGQDGSEGEATLSGKANGLGFNVGVYAQPTEELSVGISYRSKVEINPDDADVDFTTPAGVESLFQDGKLATGLPGPAVLSLGLGYKATEKLTVGLDINYNFWSVYDTLVFDYAPEIESSTVVDSYAPRVYNNAFTIRLGAQYAVSEKLDVRAGIYYDQAAADSEHMTPETPDADKIAPSIGFSYRPIKNLSIDASFLWVEGMERDINNLDTQFYGTYKSRAFVPGIGVEYSF